MSTVYAQLSQVSCGTGDLMIIRRIMSIDRNPRNWLWMVKDLLKRERNESFVLQVHYFIRLF